MADQSSLIPDAVLKFFGDTAAGIPPPGQESNLVNPYSRAYVAVIAVAILLPVTTVFVCMRTYTKARINTAGFGAEDWCCLIGFAALCAQCGVLLKDTEFGVGTHQWDVTVSQIYWFIKYSTGYAVTWCFTMCFAKLSLSIMYLKIFAHERYNTVWWCGWIIIVTNIGLYVSTFFVTILACVHGTCVNAGAVFIATSALNMANDAGTLLLPLICVWRLQMSVRRKRGVTLIIAMGIFGFVCSLMRFVASVRWAFYEDQTFTFLDQGLWSLGEGACALIASSALALPQFTKRFFPTLATWIGGHTTKGPSDSPIQRSATSDGSSRKWSRRWSRKFSKGTSNSGSTSEKWTQSSGEEMPTPNLAKSAHMVNGKYFNMENPNITIWEAEITEALDKPGKEADAGHMA